MALSTPTLLLSITYLTMPSLQPPNRYIVAISSLLVIFAVSIIVAVKYPYIDYYAQDVSAVSASVDTIDIVGGASVEVGVDQGDILVDDASSGAVSGGTANEDTLEQTINSESAETDLAEGEPVKTTSQGGKEKAPITVGSIDLSSNNNNHQGLFDHQHDDAASKKTNNNSQEEKESCISLLQQANVNSNNIIGHTEYIIFLNNLQTTLQDEIVGDGFADTNYDDLPNELQSNFEELSCQCTFGLCCSEERGIYSPNLGDGILENVCMKTLEALKDVIG